MGQVIAIRHVAFEDLGLIAPALTRAGHDVRYVEAPTADLRSIDALAPDLVVVLGGPIGACDEADYPFLSDELTLVGKRLEAGRPVLGICLGAQLLARALGARVFPGPRKEIGWAPLTLTDAGRASCLGELAEGGGLATIPVLHWHGDTFDLPDGATRLASTEACPNQAFTWGGGAALGLQFHLEAQGWALEPWFVGHAAEIVATPGVSVAELRSDTERHSQALTERGRRAFERWLAEVSLS